MLIKLDKNPVPVIVYLVEGTAETVTTGLVNKSWEWSNTLDLVTGTGVDSGTFIKSIANDGVN